MRKKAISEIHKSKVKLDNENKFSEGIEALELKHIDFFKERTSKNKSQEHDKLINHVFTTGKGKAMSLGYSSKDLPEKIQKAVEKLFNKVWKKQNKEALKK